MSDNDAWTSTVDTEAVPSVQMYAEAAPSVWTYAPVNEAATPLHEVVGLVELTAAVQALTAQLARACDLLTYRDPDDS